MEAWQQILHDIGTITAAAAAVIAAISSRSNGRMLKKNGTKEGASATSAILRGSKEKDWHRP